MIRLTRRYTFCASHRLHTDRLSDAANRELYGKCNNPYGHGHNYVLEVSVWGPVDAATGCAADLGALDALVREVLRAFDHRNLNEQVPELAGVVPTTENLALEIEKRLKARWSAVSRNQWPKLARIRIAETKRNSFEIVAGQVKPAGSEAAPQGRR